MKPPRYWLASPLPAWPRPALAPDDDKRGANTYSVKSIYDAGRSLTIRCHYGDASTDVKLVKPVTTCTYSGGDAHPALTCR